MTFPLTGLEEVDENGQQYPEIYKTAFNASNPAPFHQQVNKFFEPLIARGLRPVHTSAYFADFQSLNSTMYELITAEFMRKLVKRQDDQNDHDIVFVWDINDITMLTKNHVEELAMLQPEIKARSLYNLEECITKKANFISLEASELCSITRNVDNIEDAFVGETDEMRKAAPMYNALKELYNNVKPNDKEKDDKILSNDLLQILGIIDEQTELCHIANKHQEIYNQRWKSAKKCMELVNTRSAESKIKKYANVVLCEEGIASGAAQLLISGLSSTVPIENVYSTFRVRSESNTWHRMKLLVERLQQKFGEKCLFIHVTSGATYFEIPLEKWPIRANEWFEMLYKFQRDILFHEDCDH